MDLLAQHAQLFLQFRIICILFGGFDFNADYIEPAPTPMIRFSPRKVAIRIKE